MPPMVMVNQLHTVEMLHNGMGCSSYFTKRCNFECPGGLHVILGPEILDITVIFAVILYNGANLLAPC